MLTWGHTLTKKLFTVQRSNRKSSLVNVRHSSEAANRPVCGVFVRTPSVSHKSICVEEMAAWEERGDGQWISCSFFSVATARHGRSNRGEECEHVNSDNAELCSSLVGLLLWVHYIPVTVTNSTCGSCLYVGPALLCVSGWFSQS